MIRRPQGRIPSPSARAPGLFSGSPVLGLPIQHLASDFASSNNSLPAGSRRRLWAVVASHRLCGSSRVSSGGRAVRGSTPRGCHQARPRLGRQNSYLVDPASSHMLVSKIKPCMSKYKQLYTVKLRTAHYISNNLFDGSLLHG